MIKTVSITSECVSEASYNTFTHTLTLTFTRTHAVYEWYYCPFRKFRRLVTANDRGDSPGRVFNDEIRGRVFTEEALLIERKRTAD